MSVLINSDLARAINRDYHHIHFAVDVRLNALSCLPQEEREVEVFALVAELRAGVSVWSVLQVDEGSG